MEQMHEEATNEQTSPERLSELAKINSTLASLVANNPSSTPELLRELADREEDFIRKNVAANPNTPMEVLWKLGEKFPQEVLENAVLPLLLLENPNLIEEIPQETMISFFQCSSVPISFIEWAAKVPLISHRSYDLHLCLATNSQTPRTILKKLAGKQKFIADLAKLHVNYAGELEEDWQVEFRRHITRKAIFLGQKLYDWKETATGYFFGILAAIGLVPEFFLELLAREKETDIRCLAASSRLPLKLLLDLGRDRDPEVRATVAKNPNAPAELLELLAEDFSLIRTSVASNPNAPPKLLERLARDEQAKVREKVAKNPNAPAYLLEELARDRAVFVTVASNPNAPKTVLNLQNVERYELQRYQKLKTILAANPNTPVSILEKLEPDSLVGNSCIRKHLLEKYASSKRVSVRVALASHPQIPEDVIHLLAEDSSYRVRKTLALNPRTPLGVLLHLWQDTEPFVRRAVAANPKVPFSILEEGLPELLASRNVGAKTLLRYLREKPEGLPSLLELIFEKSFGLTRTIALWHPQMPPKVLAENARSLNWLERCAIAQNPNTPKETLQLLAADGNRIVRAAAKENLKSQ